jgi:hypothetical protein
MPSPFDSAERSADDSSKAAEQTADSDVEEDQTTPKASPNVLPPEVTVVAPKRDTALMPPPSFVRPRLNNTTSSTLAPSVSTLPPQNRPRQKVVLAPGHSPLDWARLKSSGADLRVCGSWHS